MADNKQNFQWLDIPNGRGGYDRKWAKDAEARAGIAQVASAIGIDTDYEFVDLGLPSGTLWAKCNIGATVETDYGNYYKYGAGTAQYDNAQANYTGMEDPLDAQYDTATQVMGAPWHMPTKAQVEELIANTTYEAVSDYKGSGVNGGLFTAANGNKLFIPDSGYYQDGYLRYSSYANILTSTPKSENNIYVLSCVSNSALVGFSRSTGHPVRGVKAGGLVQTKADKTELPTYATPAECRAIVTGYTPSE